MNSCMHVSFLFNFSLDSRCEYFKFTSSARYTTNLGETQANLIGKTASIRTNGIQTNLKIKIYN
ncbi:hypothetical protein BpHYR1_048303 [Brachionus plicatilis]|uniref:Uncharacterized protein n=1 Tax=Brachionus plicatilis TaxID=10195 RepID=A0A3M7Q7Z1_BRAPC|nr:hypothetical protein BpHYR1_048303 [Brachionus plicatilis]